MKTYTGCIMVLIGLAFVFTLGCTTQTTPPVSTPVVVTPAVVPTATVPLTTIQTPVPTTTAKRDKITDGFWCRDTTMNLGKAPTDVRECYKFSTDGTFTWGYAPGRLMGKSPSCWAPDVNCTYSLTADGKYQVSGGYFYTLSGDILVDSHDQPAFTRSLTGIP